MLDCNLEYFRAFYYVAKFQSVTRAANMLHLSQPTVTHSIKQLEDYLGCKLFSRNPRGMQITAKGNILFAHVSKAMETLLEGEIHVTASKISGVLTIGATETALYYYLLPKIENFRNMHQSVQFHITGSSTAELIKLLDEGKADLAITVSPLPEESENVDITPLSSFRDIVVAGPKFTELRGRTITPKELCLYPMTTVESGTSARYHIDQWFHGQSIPFQPEYSVRTSSLVLPFVERNISLGILPSMFAEDSIAQEKVFEVQVQPEIPPRQILILYSNRIAMSPLCVEFSRYLQTFS